MPVDPLQLQQQENLGAPTPSPIRPDLGAAEMAGQKIEAFEEQDKFKALLEGGVEAMAATRQRLIQEGVINETDLQDPTQFPEFQQPQNGELRLKWWQELSSKIQKSEATKKKAEGIQKFQDAPTSKEKIGVGVEEGFITPGAALKSTILEETDAKLTASENAAQKIASQITGKETKSELVKLFSAADALLTETAKRTIDAVSTPSAGSDRQNQINKRFDKRLFDKQLSQYKSNSKNLVATVQGIKRIDESFPGGIYGNERKGLGVVGFGTKAFKKFVNSDEGIKLRQAVNVFFLAKLKDLSGVAVSDEEFQRVESAHGLNTRGTVEAFVQSLINASDETAKRVDLIGSGLLPEVESVLKKDGVWLSDLIPRRKSTKSSSNKDLTNNIFGNDASTTKTRVTARLEDLSGDDVKTKVNTIQNLSTEALRQRASELKKQRK